MASESTKAMDTEVNALDSCMLGMSIEFYEETSGVDDKHELAFNASTDELILSHDKIMGFQSEKIPAVLNWDMPENTLRTVPEQGVFVVYVNVIGNAGNLHYGLMAMSYNLVHEDKTGKDRRAWMKFLTEEQLTGKRMRWEDEDEANELSVKHVRTDQGSEAAKSEEKSAKFSIGFNADVFDFTIWLYKETLQIDRITLSLKIHEQALADKLEDLAQALLVDLGSKSVDQLMENLHLNPQKQK